MSSELIHSELVLYSTEHCSLCDEALEMLFSMPELAGRSVRVVDIADDDDLLAAFGEKLPVLLLHHAGAAENSRLEWPFDRADVIAVLG